jgi:hypothetical protein
MKQDAPQAPLPFLTASVFADRFEVACVFKKSTFGR